MKTDEDPLKNVHVSITPGCCIVCDVPISGGLFCPRCAPLPTTPEYYPIETIHRESGEVTVEELNEGKPAYIEPLSIFTHDDRLYVIISTMATFSPHDQYRPIKIIKWSGIVYVYKKTVKPNYIFQGYEALFSDYPVARADYIE